MSNSSISNKALQNGVEILVRGIVQGVGFRPFIFKLASRFRIAGTVRNTSEGVIIRAIARDESIFSFIEAISAEAPPLATIIALDYRPLERPLQADSFTIVASRESAAASAITPPDIALCDDCLEELLDPADRRHRYPFINCTNCGPRFSIIETIPYDRSTTSMKVFPMCPSCRAEYGNPADRRFHAQPNACPVCGPSISWHDERGLLIDGVDVVEAAIAALRGGKVVALRGLGGFHLCADGCSEEAVATLRTRKNRPTKPLAVMVRDLESAGRLCRLLEPEARALESPQHPIVLLEPQAGGPLAANLAPGMSDIGVMLPYTPLHHLLFAAPRCPAALVMTSGNVSGEPICTANDEAIRRLAGIADHFLLHDRDIVTRVDDSVVKVVGGDTRLMRRARGYVPGPLLVPYDLPEIIGCGAGLKSTFSLARGSTVFPSQHIGDLFSTAAYDFFRESVENLTRLLEIEPQAVACDMHPDYLSSHFAGELGLPLYRVQHHHAHAAAVMAEHGLTRPVLAVVLDGTGYGPDKTIWGGEILQADLTSFSRLGALEQVPLPGGDAASAEPWRMALSFLYRLQGTSAADSALLAAIDPGRRRVVTRMLEQSFNTPLTSSCGRLFDAVAALLGLNTVASFEGEAAMQLETCARQGLERSWNEYLKEIPVDESALVYHEKTRRWEIISSTFITEMVYGIASGVDRSEIALRFHSWLIGCISRLVEKLSGHTGIGDIVLSGGCMQNGLLLEGLLFTLEDKGLTVYSGAGVPVNDGGISVGQAVIGGLQHVSCRTDES